MTLIAPNRRDEIELGITLRQQEDEWKYSAEKVLETLTPISLELVRTELGSLGVHNLYHEVYQGPDLNLNIQWEGVIFHNAFCPAQLVSSDYEAIVSRALGTIMVDGEVYEPLNDDSKVVFSVGEATTNSATKPSIRMAWTGSAVHETSPERSLQFRVAMPVKLNFDWQLEIICDGDIHVESPEIQDESFVMQLDSNLEELDEGSPILTLYDCGTGDKMTCYRGTSISVGTPVLFVEAFFSLSRGPQRISQKGMEASDSTYVRVRCDEEEMVVTPGQMLVLDEVKKLFRAFFLFKVVVDPNICMAEVPVAPMSVASVSKMASNRTATNGSVNGMVAQAPMEMMQE